MSLAKPLLHLAGRLVRPIRDPRRAARTWQAYDEGRGYAAYLARCQATFDRPEPPPAPEELDRRGFSYLRALPANVASQMAGELESRQPERLKKDSKDLEGFRISDAAWRRQLLARVLRDEVDSAITGFFGSEYLVHWLALSLTRAAPEQDSVSFRWHCDKGPTAHLKLIVYLNGTESHGGNTEFIDLEDTAAVAREGYLFGWSKTRTGDIGALSRLAGRALSTHLEPRGAGEAVLFQPARVLHRGITPTRGDRLTATLCLLPSPVHWQRALECETLSDLAVDEKWHEDALGFLADLERRLNDTERNPTKPNQSERTGAKQGQ